MTPAVLTDPTPLSCAQLARRIPAYRGSGRATPSCVSRWITTGTRGPDGRRVRLEAVRVGSRWVTSWEAYMRYVATLTPTVEADRTPIRSPGERQRASERAARALERAGI